LKKPAGSVRFGFGFISLKQKKTNRTEPKLKKTVKKPSQTDKKASKTKKTKPKPS
jgi:hypothetical protein